MLGDSIKKATPGLPTAPGREPTTAVGAVRALIRRFGLDGRTVAFLLPALFVLFLDAGLAKTIGMSMAIAVLFGAGAHVLRKLFFPYIDMERIAARACESPVGAGLVFAGVSMLMGAVFYACALWLSH